MLVASSSTDQIKMAKDAGSRMNAMQVNSPSPHPPQKVDEDTQALTSRSSPPQLLVWLLTSNATKPGIELGLQTRQDCWAPRRL